MTASDAYALAIEEQGVLATARAARLLSEGLVRVADVEAVARDLAVWLDARYAAGESWDHQVAALALLLVSDLAEE